MADIFYHNQLQFIVVYNISGNKNNINSRYNNNDDNNDGDMQGLHTAMGTCTRNV